MPMYITEGEGRVGSGNGIPGRQREFGLYVNFMSMHTDMSDENLQRESLKINKQYTFSRAHLIQA